jgi:hypothetical protein
VAELLTWVVVIVTVISSVGAGQYYVLFYRQAWRRRIALPDPCFFLDELVPVGGIARLRAHSRHPFEVRVRHATRLDAPVWSGDFPAQERDGRYDHWRGLEWRDPIDIPTAGLAEGPHRVEVIHKDGSGVFAGALLVRTATAPVLVVCSTNTWQAYNAFGGLSNYRMPAVPLPLRLFLRLVRATGWRIRVTDRVDAPVTPLPLRRPLSSIDDDLQGKSADAAPHLFSAELPLMCQLDALGISYAVASDADIDAGLLEVLRPRLVLFAAHSEYWTTDGVAALSARIHQGGGTVFLSGNNVYRRVERFKDHLRVVEQMIAPDETAALIGSAYDARGYLDFAGYLVVRPDHWLLAETGLAAGDRFAGGASGFETDKRRVTTPADTTLVAIGENAEGPAHLICRDLKGGGFVVNVGSVAFTSALGRDSAANQILKNILQRAGVS